MKKLTRFGILLLSLFVFLAGFAACGKTETKGETDSGNPGGVTEEQKNENKGAETGSDSKETDQVSRESGSGNEEASGRDETETGSEKEETASSGSVKSSDAEKSSDPETSSGSKTVEEMLAEKNKIEPVLEKDGVSYGYKPGVSAYLFMGVDKRGEAEGNGSYYGGGQADSLLLLVTDDTNKSYSILEINRDTVCTVDILDIQENPSWTTEEHICLSHYYGDGTRSSCENTVRAVSRLLGGVEIEGYYELKLDAINALNDALGGVTVTIEDDFSQADKTLVMGETITLTGTQAETYVRGRMSVGDGQNVSRMRRQRTYLTAALAKFKEKMKEDSSIYETMVSLAEPYEVTNLSKSELASVALNLRTYVSEGFVSIPGEFVSSSQSKSGYLEFYPDETKLEEIVLNLFYTEATK